MTACNINCIAVGTLISVLKNLYKFAITILGLQYISYTCATHFVGSKVSVFKMLWGLCIHCLVDPLIAQISNDDILINIHSS